MNDIEFTYIHLPEDIRIHTALAGPPTGKPILLLHGFPDFWYGWRHQIPFLAQNGFRVIAPDQRGYNLSSKPKHYREYNLDILCNDVIGLLDYYKISKTILIGHDWGGGVSWRFAQRFPDRVQKLIVINVPHSRVLKDAIRKSWKQRMKSWYIFAFQIPRLPELALQSKRILKNGLVRSSLPGTFSEMDLNRYDAAWSQEGALTGMINWYRALLKTKVEKVPDPVVQIPTLLLWGAGDGFLGRELAVESMKFCSQGELKFFEEATHWVHQEIPEKINPILIDFILK